MASNGVKISRLDGGTRCVWRSNGKSRISFSPVPWSQKKRKEKGVPIMHSLSPGPAKKEKRRRKRRRRKEAVRTSQTSDTLHKSDRHTDRQNHFY